MLDFSSIKNTNRRKLDMILDELPEEDAAALTAALNDKNLDSTAIARLLRNQCGYDISDRSVQTYRKDILWR